MTFGESVDRARDRCNAVMLERIAERRASGVRVIVEAAPRDSAGQIVAAPDGLKLPLRYDLVFEDSTGKFQTENADSVTIDFPAPVSVTWEHRLNLEIHRLCWDYMLFEFPGDAVADWEWLRVWFMRWFDVQDARPADAHGLFGVVHFVSDPEVDRGVARFFVDFGSAPTDSLAALLDTFVQAGVTRCAIGKKQNIC